MVAEVLQKDGHLRRITVVADLLFSRGEMIVQIRTIFCPETDGV